MVSPELKKRIYRRLYKDIFGEGIAFLGFAVCAITEVAGPETETFHECLITLGLISSASFLFKDITRLRNLPKFIHQIEVDMMRMQGLEVNESTPIINVNSRDG